MSPLSVILIVVLLLLVLGAFPTVSPWAATWGHGPAGVLGLVLVIVVVLALLGKL